MFSILMYKYRRRDVWTTILILASLSLPSLAGSVEESLRSRREEGSEGDLDNKEVLEGSDLLSEGKEEGVSDKCAGVTCHNGDCVVEGEGGKENGRCQCWHGWRGDQCELCGGRVKMTEENSRSWLAEAAGNYTTNMKCTWLVEATNPGSRIRLHLKDFETECGWDHLYIWDGDNIFSGLQAVYSGLVKTKDKSYKTSSVSEVVGESGSMLLHFYSDVAYNMTGFNITFTVDSCPSNHYQNTCSGRGSCNYTSGLCNCDRDFKGLGCERVACPENCGLDEGRGQCVGETERRCECTGSWRGESCKQKAEVGWWEVGSEGGEEVAGGGVVGVARTSHSAAVQGDSMWVVGGEFLHRAPPGSMVRRWHLAERRWMDVNVAEGKTPSERYGHSVVVHEDKLYVYGGVMRSGHVSKELWSLDLTSFKWERELVKTGRCHSSLCGEIHCAGHTATVVQNRMVVIFGHSPQLGYLDTVQEYHFGSREWAVVETSGYPVKGGYGHSAVLDTLTNKIYVYGGYVSHSPSVAQLSSEVYAFDHLKAEWELRTASPSARYLHSAVVHHGLMLVFGGNTHNDTQYSQGAKCYSRDFLAYDIQCDQWVSLQDTLPTSDFSADLDRFGHSAVLHNGTLVVYGGFNGQTKGDIILFHPGQCSHVKEEEECVASYHGLKCVWNRKKDICEVWGQAGKKNSASLCSPHTRNNTGVCSSQGSCHSCLATSLGCVWCSDGCHAGTKCPKMKDIKAAHHLAGCPEFGAREVCENLHTCESCDKLPDRCWWNTEKQCQEKQTTGINSSEEGSSGSAKKEPVGHCPVSCSENESCGNCTSRLCMWCHNMHMCVDRNAYLASFPYGQCMDWTTSFDQCPGPSPANETKLPNLCRGYDTCTDCQANPACGWCDEGSGTGLGKCLEGGASGPLNRTSRLADPRGHQWSWIPSDACPAPRWHFTECPACQCNGHSTCIEVEGDLEEEEEEAVCGACLHHTTGDHCQQCAEGFFGHPVNGGKCKPCECNGQGTSCDHRSGNCFCTTKGITGDHCEKCDTQNHYFGDPINSSCFYDLAIDYQFTFNLSKPEDKHYTAINFKNVPTKPDVDVDFSISCSVNAKMNLTYRHASKEGKKEDIVLSEKNCSNFKYRFSKGDYTFGNEENTTFYVYVYDFQPPLWIIISFSQHPKLDLLQFFITFSTCFLALLLIAAILWKIKQKYDRYRRRQRLYVEMEQMASRPFGQVLTELERIPDSESSHQHTRKRKKKPRPSPIALEPCAGNRAAVLTLLVRMPTGGSSYAPPGVPGIALASSLVTLGNPRKASVDPTQKVEPTDPNSKLRKSRKVVASGVTQPTDL